MTFAGAAVDVSVGHVIAEQASLAATYYPARGERLGLLVCLPRGICSRDY
ncbi:hypothetical protein [Mycobacterium sp. E1747]|nr:hypothetical protein [Mycobacterium sp. E1747]